MNILRNKIQEPTVYKREKNNFVWRNHRKQQACSATNESVKTTHKFLLSPCSQDQLIVPFVPYVESNLAKGIYMPPVCEDSTAVHCEQHTVCSHSILKTFCPLTSGQCGKAISFIKTSFSKLTLLVSSSPEH